MYEGWFAGWFGGWFSEWFGGGSEVPAPTPIGGGHVPDDQRQRKERRQRGQEQRLLEISTAQARQHGRAAVQTETGILLETSQQPAAAATRIEFERAPVRLPPVRRQEAVAFRQSASYSTIGEFIPKPRLSLQHPSPRAATRPQRQEAMRTKKAAPQRTADEEAIMRAIKELL